MYKQELNADSKYKTHTSRNSHLLFGKQVTNGDREIDISVPSPMVSRLGLTVRLSKDEERQAEINEAHRLKAAKLSLSKIGEIMNKTKRQVQELIKKQPYHLL